MENGRRSSKVVGEIWEMLGSSKVVGRGSIKEVGGQICENGRGSSEVVGGGARIW